MDELPKVACCCGGKTGTGPICGDDPDRTSHPSNLPLFSPWLTGSVSTAVGEIRRASTTLRASDRLGAWKVRWGIGRMRYRVEPGLYAVGEPTAEAPVMVSANYKMSFDRLRCQLRGLNAWILVLETKGINVWCAAGKGTFGTDEIVRRIDATRLAEVVSHRRLLVPQLGAPGVAAHEVKRQSGFRVVYGPVRAEDLPAFLAADLNATPEMRRVRFPLADRLAVVPVELATSAKYVLLLAVCFLILAGLGSDGYSSARVAGVGVQSALLLLATAVGSILFAPALLPWLPGRAFSVKGGWLGLVFLLFLMAWAWLRGGVFDGWLTVAAWCLLIPTVASFLAMNFTGASTYTSLSGVRKEMALAVPAQIVCGTVGVALWLVGRFV